MFIEIFPVPVYLSNRGCSNECICDLFIKQYKGRVALKSVNVIYKGLYNGTLVNVDGIRVYLGGKTNRQIYVSNAVSLILDNELNVYIKLLEKIKYKMDNKAAFNINTIKTTYLNKEIKIEEEKNFLLYKKLIEKISTLLFWEIPKDKFEVLQNVEREEFLKLPLEKQVSALMDVLNVITNFIDDRNVTDLHVQIARGTIGLDITKKNKFSVITTSITGLYENEIKIK